MNKKCAPRAYVAKLNGRKNELFRTLKIGIYDATRYMNFSNFRLVVCII